MSRRPGAVRPESKKVPRVLTIIIPAAVLLLLIATLVYVYCFPGRLANSANTSPTPPQSLQEILADPPEKSDTGAQSSQTPTDRPPPADTGPTVGSDQDALTGGDTPPDADTYPQESVPYEDDAAESASPPGTDPIIKPNGDLFSASALLMNLDTGETVFENNAGAKNYPASLTKILSAVVILESGVSPDTVVTITDAMLDGLLEAYASVAGFEVGDEVSVTDLLYGLMLPSGADCANALAITVAGSINGFVDLMNAKAASLGMSSSHFTNPTGLHSESQYTTAADLAVLLEHALENDLFYTIFTSATYTTAPTASHPDGIALNNYILSGDLDITFTGGRILGAKTGFTTPAGQCLASYTAIGGTGYILITMGAGREFDFNDHYSLLDALYLYNCVGTGKIAG